MVGKLPSDGCKTLGKVYSGEGSDHANAALQFQRWCPARPGVISAQSIAKSQSLYNIARTDYGE